MDLGPAVTSMMSQQRQDAYKSAKSFQKALRESHAAPEDHRLPWYVIWGITLLIPILVACVNFLMVMADLFLMNWKFRVTQEARESSSGDSILVLLGISVALAGCAAFLVLMQPSCAGSGIPEAKGYLNGNEVPSFLDPKCFLVRFAALVLAVAAGFPVGREGPMVCLGGCLGMGVAKCIASPYMKTWVEVETESSSITAKMVTEKQLSYVLRMSFILGGAAGIATAFRAPVGAVLYLFEEVTVTAWSIEFTLRAFVCTVLAAITSSLLLDVTGYDIHRLLIYDGTVPQPRDWQWQDVPFFILLALLAGVISALFTRGLLTCWRLRQMVKKFQEAEGWSDLQSMSYRFMEVVCYAGLCALIFGVVPGLTPCLQGRDNGSGKGLILVRYDCEEGSYNEVASLLLSGAEGATKDLFSREVLHLTASSVAITLCVYLPLAMGVAGLLIPMGAFVPNMLLGALLGRLFGRLLENMHLQELWGLAHPGVYALVGSGAMLGGFTQMTVAVVVMLVEAVSDLSVVSPLMLGISVARVVSGFINRHAYDEELVIRKGIPFLEAEPPSHHVEALQIYQKQPLPKAALLPVHCSEGVAAAALRVNALHYPVIDEHHLCVGVISRTLLQRTNKAMLRARGSNMEVEDQGDLLPLSDIMDRTPEVVHADTPLLRIWSLFIHGRAEKVVIISHRGTFQGLISRPPLLIQAMEDVESSKEGSPQSPQSPERGSETNRSAKSRSAKLSQPRTHNLPNYIIWAVAFITAGLIGVINFLMVTLDSQLVSWKFNSMQHAMDYNGALLGAVTLSAISGLFAASAAALVVFIAPICAGSGLPEAKSYLNGNFVPNMFEPRNFLVRVIGVVLSTAAGFPIGREGPMVCIGGCLGIGVMHIFALPFLRRWVEVGTHGKRPALLIEDDRFRHAKRIGCVLGGAAGIATAFSAPIGAILYMLEEVTVIAWSPELTFRTFVATTLGALVTRFCLNFSGFEIDRLVIYERAFRGQKDWNWIDLPFFILVASIMGAVAAAFTRALVFSFSFRQRWRKQRPWLQRPSVRIAEAALLAMVIALVFGLVPSFFGCEENKPRLLLAEQAYEVGGQHHEDDTGHHETLYFVKYTCEGESFFNEAATLLLSGEEGVVKHLYTRSPDAVSIPPLLLALVVYAPFAASMAGLSVPMGVFIPSMLIGAMTGRLIGEVVRFLDLNLAHPGVYSLIGSVAMLSGFTQMTLAIVMLLVEATLDLELIPPLMLSSFVARVVASMLLPHAYDEQLIMKKGHAFLDAELPDAVNGFAAKAVDLLQTLPKEAFLQFSTAVQDVQKALAKEEVMNFPVVEGGQCIGLVKRSWLHSALRARTLDREELYRNPLAETNAWKRSSDAIVRLVLGERLEIDEPEGDGFLSMVAIMDTGAYTILEDTPLGRFYHLFTRAGLDTACVISKTGEFRGILSKADILTYLSKANEENHNKKKRARTEAMPAMMKSTRKAERPREGSGPSVQGTSWGSAESDPIGPEDITMCPSPKVLGNVNGDMELWVDARQAKGLHVLHSSRVPGRSSRIACCLGPWSYPN